MKHNRAKQLITGASGNVNTMYHDATTEDIIRVIAHADSLSARYTALYTEDLRRKHGDNLREMMHDVWRLLRGLKYRADDSHQKIKSPAQLIADGVGDCKSYSVFVASVLKNLGVPYVYRYADYDRDNDVNHVYVIAKPNGRKPIIIDAVHTAFDEEAKGANYAFDLDVSTNTRNVAKMSGIDNGHSTSFVGVAIAGIILLLMLFR